MRLWITFGLTASIGAGFRKGLGYAFTSPTFRCSSVQVPPNRCSTNKCRAMMMESFNPSEAVKRRLAGDGRANPIYRQLVVFSLKWATEGVGRYFQPGETAGGRDPEGENRESARVKSKDLQSQLGPLVDIVLSPAPDKENAEAISKLLDRCQESSGTGATLALGLLDTVWSMPVTIRPEIGDFVISAVYEALRRYGVFTRYGALKPPDIQVPSVEEPRRLVDGMEDTEAFAAAKFGLSARTASIGVLMFGFICFLLTSASSDLRLTYSAVVFMLTLIFEREVLHGALFDAVVQLIQPNLTELTSVHEAGHVTVAYLAGCPISTYTLGGVPSLQHGDALGCGPSCNIINAELALARITPLEEVPLLKGDPSGTEGKQTADLEVSYKYAAQKDRSRRDASIWREVWGSDRSPASKASRVRPAAAQLSQEGRYAAANRYALSAMGGVVGETLVNGFGLGGLADQWDLRRTLKVLWPSISDKDLISTEKWALVEGLRVLKDDRKCIEVLAKNMRETREIGRLLLDLERTLTANEFECTVESVL